MRSLLLLSSVLLLAGCATQEQKASEALFNHDYKTAYTEYLALAQGGDYTAESQLGYMYYKGEGVPADSEKAEYWYEKSAMDGNNQLAQSFGDAYRYRSEPDYANAFKWYKLAADRNDPYSALVLSVFYENGLGVARDHEAALHWLNFYVGRTDIVGQKVALKYSGGDNMGGFIAAMQEVFYQEARHTPEMSQYNTGVVELSFSEQDGRAANVHVIKSSGDSQADAAMVAVIQKTYLPPVLASLSYVTSFTIGMNFEIPRAVGTPPTH